MNICAMSVIAVDESINLVGETYDSINGDTFEDKIYTGQQCAKEIFYTGASSVKEKLWTCAQGMTRQRPFIRAKVNGYGRDFEFLYDTGASKTCLTWATFNKMYPKHHPRQLKHNILAADLHDAGKNSLELFGVFEMDFEILGRKFKHEVRVLKKLTQDIIGIDLIHKQHLQYDTVNREIFWAQQTKQNTAVLSLTEEIYIPEMTKQVIETYFNGTTTPNSSYVATIFSPESRLISGGPALIKIGEKNMCYIEVANCAPFGQYLSRGSIIAMVEKEDINAIQEMDGKVIDDFIQEIKEKDDHINAAAERKTLSRQEIEQRANMKVPQEFKKKYLDLLSKYSDVISVDKHDLGKANDFYHRINLKDKAPVYRKQFVIPEAHHDFIEQSLAEWLKLE